MSKAVASVFAQTCTDYEVIVVDDGSTDGTQAALARHGGSLRRIGQRNGGPASARNAGALAATGEYLAFLDSDDWWFPGTLEHYAAAAASAQRPSWLYGRGSADAHDPGAWVGSALGALDEAFRIRYLDAAALDGVMPLLTGVAVRRDVFLRAGGFTGDDARGGGRRPLVSPRGGAGLRPRGRSRHARASAPRRQHR